MTLRQLVLSFSLFSTLAAGIARADDLFAPITCGSVADITWVNPLLGRTKLSVHFANAISHRYIESDAVWSEYPIGKTKDTTKVPGKFTSYLDPFLSAAESAAALKMRFCIQYDEQSELGKRYGAGFTDGEAIAEMMTR